MAFNVTYLFNNGAVTGTATSITALRSAIYNYAHSGSVSNPTGFNYNHLTQCTLSGTAEGQLTTGNIQGTTTGLLVGLFYGCSALTSLDISNLNTSNVTNMHSMLSSCSSLTSLDISNLNTSSVTDMVDMFNNCSSLTSLDVSNFDTSNVTDMSGTFYHCTGLTSLDVSNWSTSNVEAMESMFSSCEALTSLDISSFNTSKVTNMSWMFNGCSNLEHIYVSSNWKTTQVTNSTTMLYGCTKLPNYVANSTDKTKAHTGTNGCLENLADIIKTAEVYYKYGGGVSKLKVGENFPTIEVTATGSYKPTSGNSPYGACINKDGYMVIYAYSYSTDYEHYYFVNTSIPATFGTIADGWNLTSWDTNDNATHLEACTIKGIDISKYSKIKVALNFNSRNSTYDYAQCNVTITTE